MREKKMYNQIIKNLADQLSIKDLTKIKRVVKMM